MRYLLVNPDREIVAVVALSVSGFRPAVIAARCEMAGTTLA
jgi:hypothetical protein